MKHTIQTLSILVTLAATACHDSDVDSSVEPVIAFKNIEYTKDDVSYQDELSLTFSFKDNQADFGLSATDIDSPYHYSMLLLATGNGNFDLMNFEELNVSEKHLTVPVVRPDQHGLLATDKTPNETGYEFLPDGMHCDTTYSYLQFSRYQDNAFAIRKEDANIIDSSFDVYDSTSAYYFLSGKFLVKKNRNFYNLFIKLLIKQDNGTYEEYSLENECISFNARVPRIPFETIQPFSAKMTSKTSGDITFHLRTLLFRDFLGKEIKLQFYIQDRALHKSNIVETSDLLIQ